MDVLDLDSLPEEWTRIAFGKAVEFTRKPRGLRIEQHPEVTFLPMELLPDNSLETAEFESREPAAVTSGVYFEEADILLAKITPCMQNGKQAIARNVPNGWGIATTEVYAFKPKQHVTDFLGLFLRHPVVLHSLASKLQGATGRQRLPRGALGSLELPLPPLPEQRAITAVLRAVQRAKEAAEAVVSAARQLKRSLLRHLFTYGPVPVDRADRVPLKDTDIGPIPEHWAVRPLGEVADLCSGGTPSKSRPDFWDGLIPWASPKDLKRPRLHDTIDHVSEAGVTDGSRLVQPGSIFIVVRGMILANDIPLAMAMVPMAFNQDMKAIVARKGISPDYLLYALVANKAILDREIGSAAHGTKRIGTAALEQFPIPVPASKEQEIISSALRAVEQKIQAEQARVSALGELFRSLLRDLMTGRVRVHESDIPAGAGT